MKSLTERMKLAYENTVLQMRLRAGYKKQKDLAERAGISPSILSDIESNRLFLSSPYALRLAEVLGCKLDDLFVLKREFVTSTENARLKALLERCRSWVDTGTDLHESIDAVLEGDEDE